MKVSGIRAGHFYMLRTADALDPLLSRPLGVYRILNSAGAPLLSRGGQDGTFSGDGLEFLYNVVGRGTALLARKKPGDNISLLGPLGNGFPASCDIDAERIIMVGGGMGIVPFYLQASLLQGGLFLFGARGVAETRLTEDFSHLSCRVEVSTEDGSAGVKGFVTALLDRELKEDSVVYACGPPAMLKAVAAMSRERAVRSYVSLEKRMACGIGVCLGCAVKTKAGHECVEKGGDDGGALKMVCSEGPVFDSDLIDWDDIY